MINPRTGDETLLRNMSRHSRIVCIKLKLFSAWFCPT